MMRTELRRQLVHVAMGAFAFALPYLNWLQAAGLALTALIVNLVLLPRLARQLFRAGELEHRLVGGIVFYPLSVLMLVVTFPTRPDIVAMSWGVLAAGDGLATLAGQAVGGPRLPWNRDKTWAGTIAFVVAAAVAGTVLAWWTLPVVNPAPPWWFLWTAPIVAAVAAGLVESMPLGLDDNLSVPAVAAASAWVVSVISADAATASWPLVVSRMLPAVAINVVVAAASHRARAVDLAGALAGFVVGSLVWLGAGGRGWLLLFAAFLIVVVTSRAGLKRKMVLGIAEGRGGRRGPGNTIANCGVAMVAALLIVWSGNPALASVLFVTALATSASDTVASEIGKAFGQTTWLVTSLRRVPPGTSGALSVEGTVAGVAAAFALGLLGTTILGLAPVAWLWMIVVAATVGSLVESVLGATLEASGVLNNDVLNFLNTVVAVLVAAVLVRSLS